MNKLFKLAQTKGKWHKFPSFNLGGGAKLYKNFAQKTLVALTAIAMLSASVWGVGGGFFGGPTPGNGLLRVVAYEDESCDAGHSFNDYTYNDDATCTEAGTKTAYCDRCGEEDTIPDPAHPATGHSFGEYTYDDDATCTEGGTKVATCRNCEEESIIPDPDHPATGHTFGDYKLDPGSTCEHGTMTAVCVNCGEATHTIPATHLFQGSSWTSNGDVSCTTAGTMSRSCANCTYKETKDDPYAPPLGHELEEKILAATPTAIGAMQQVCTRCSEVISNDYFMMDGTFPTNYAEGGSFNDTAPCAPPVHIDVNGKTYTIILQDPLRTLVTDDSDVLGLEVSLVEEPADFDGFADGAPDSGDTSAVENMSTFNIVPTVNGVRKSGQLNKKVRMLYLLNNGEDREEMETVLLKKGVDTHFAEDLDTIGDDKYLVTWTDHFSTYAFIDRLTDADKAPENKNSFPVIPVIVGSSVLMAACVAGVFIYIKKKKNAA